jgi:leucine dehydrogenase
MTYKAAVAGLFLGGAKAVILADGREQNPVVRKARLRALGSFVESLDGHYIAAEDVGTTTADILTMREITRHVVGLPSEAGGSGDPSQMTAFGVFEGQRAMCQDVLSVDSFKDIRVTVQGLGKVGMNLAARLVTAGARVIATDIRSENRRLAEEQLGIQTVEPDTIYDRECEIFAPCALGGIINDSTLPRLKCKIVAGSANNQLEDPRHGNMLADKGIAYAVDFVINAGGLINVAHELRGYVKEEALAQAAKIYETVKHMLTIARRGGISEEQAAHQMAMERLQFDQLPAGTRK